MASHRPKRTRKIVNYGEDHLHWVEENQIQKALLRSLHESPAKKLNLRSVKHSSSTEQDDGNCSDDLSDISDTEIKPKPASSNKRQINKSKDIKRKPMRPEENFELRLTRLQSKLLEEHGIFDPNMTPDSRSKYDQIISDTQNHCHVNLESMEEQSRLKQPVVKARKLTRKNLFSSEEAYVSDEGGQESSFYRVRAQRKFASNCSPPRTRSNSPVKMHRQKQSVLSDGKDEAPKARRSLRNMSSGSASQSNYVRPVRALSSESDPHNPSDVLQTNGETGLRRSNRKSLPTSVFNMVPKTDKFLSYLCFRNTSIKFDLEKDK
uniref:Uncharacterized protein LOC100177519 n=1 Tax=Phallusia mammillata TaxID=59560 RepID=A0A6F9DGX0_9ASCI|nr:uncharacterized protein LOC100177519 [Phallusia mammillata]